MTISSILKKQVVSFIVFFTISFLSAQQQYQKPNVNLFKYSLPIQKLEKVDSLSVSRSVDQIEALKKTIKLKDEKSQSIRIPNKTLRIPIYRAEGDLKWHLKRLTPLMIISFKS